MSRKKRADKRVIHPDPVYKSVLITKFVNGMMLDGKRSKSEKAIYDALKKIKDKTKQDELEQFNEIIEKSKPNVEVRSRRVGGATYQVPVEVRPERQQALAIRWIIGFARKRNERTISDKLFGEFMDILGGNASTLKKRSDTHKMAEANKAFAHFRW